MRYLTFVCFVLLIVFSTCRDRVSESYIEHKVLLKNNLGELSIKLPPEFDTTYYWTRYSDNPCADIEMFRFANKKYSLLRENGAVYPVRPDSLYQLTISQSKHLDCDHTPKIDKELLALMIDNHIMINHNIEIFVNEIKTIQNKDFILIGSRFEAKTTLELLTDINGHSIRLEFVYQGENNFNFVERMKRSINSIKIDTLHIEY